MGTVILYVVLALQAIATLGFALRTLSIKRYADENHLVAQAREFSKMVLCVSAFLLTVSLFLVILASDSAYTSPLVCFQAALVALSLSFSHYLQSLLLKEQKSVQEENAPK